MLQASFTKQRQQRLLAAMNRMGVDAVVLGIDYNVYYFSAHPMNVLHHGAMVVHGDGRTWLATAMQPDQEAAVDEAVGYPAKARSTLRQDQPQVLAGLVAEELRAKKAKAVAIDSSAVGAQVAIGFGRSVVSIDPELWQIRRVKLEDELTLMKKGIACCRAMYARARQIIRPGISEIEVYAELHAAAVREAGEALVPAYLGNDFACGVPGGRPRGDRLAKDGELYILDLGPAYRGYFSDNARVIAVNRRPTDAQHKAWGDIAQCLKIVESLARPGARGVELFTAVDEHLKSAGRGGLRHHLGHGVGLQPHEFPHLNPEWDDVLMEGEVFTAEPGTYGPELAGGIRLENQYLVTKNGVLDLLGEDLAMA